MILTLSFWCSPPSPCYTVNQIYNKVGSLKANACDLARRMDLCRKDALRESRQGERQAALVHMRRMKQLKTARGKCLSSLLTLEAALDQAGDA